MPEFPNPHLTDNTRKHSPGELAQAWANLLAVCFVPFGLSLYVHEVQALATVIGAALRAYPRLREIGLDMGTNKEHKG